jgi:hypothetical protein
LVLDPFQLMLWTGPGASSALVFFDQVEAQQWGTMIS